MAKSITNPAKKKAWDNFSRMIRVRDCIATTGIPFVGVCITCQKRFHIRALQAGHCFPGRNNGRLFQEKLVNAQCVICNERLHGRLNRYKEAMINKYGEKQVKKWEIEGKKVIHNRDMDFEGRADEYKKRTNEMLKPFGYMTYNQMMKR
jgi:hypothetical protein